SVRTSPPITGLWGFTEETQPMVREIQTLYRRRLSQPITNIDYCPGSACVLISKRRAN
ncbi:hypothetical protein ACJ72_08488, partial [Emergomyces africanus]